MHAPARRPSRGRGAGPADTGRGLPLPPGRSRYVRAGFVLAPTRWRRPDRAGGGHGRRAERGVAVGRRPAGLRGGPAPGGGSGGRRGGGGRPAACPRPHRAHGVRERVPGHKLAALARRRGPHRAPCRGGRHPGRLHRGHRRPSDRAHGWYVRGRGVARRGCRHRGSADRPQLGAVSRPGRALWMARRVVCPTVRRGEPGAGDVRRLSRSARPAHGPAVGVALAVRAPGGGRCGTRAGRGTTGPPRGRGGRTHRGCGALRGASTGHRGADAERRRRGRSAGPCAPDE